MFFSRSSNNKINKLHERALRIVYDDYNSKFEELLTKDGPFTIHHKNIQTLEKEMFKTHHGFSQVSFLDLFLDFVTKLQKYTTLAYSGSTSECIKRDVVMAAGDQLREN